MLHNPRLALELLATTVREPDVVVDDLTAESAWRHSFPPAEVVNMAAAALRDVSGMARNFEAGCSPEGPRAFVSVSPGSIRFFRVDLARRERSVERRRRARLRDVGLSAAVQASNDLKAGQRQLAAFGLVPMPEPDDTDPLLGRDPVREVVQWSAKSRANMTRRLLTLDYGPMVAAGVPALVTVTEPGDWLTVAPNGKAFKRHVEAWKVRYERAWGERIKGIWKLEFQRRGAPHLHMLMVPPAGHAAGKGPGAGLAFRQWLSWSWADVVAHPDPAERMKHEGAGTAVDYAEGLKATDPQRIAVYFNKHGMLSSKEYQHIVPVQWRGPGDGPGRFWGVWGLYPVERVVPLATDDAICLARTARRWYRSKGGLRLVKVDRVEQATGRIRRRTVRRRIKRLGSTWGFMAANDGPALAMMLADTLETARGAGDAGRKRSGPALPRIGNTADLRGNGGAPICCGGVHVSWAACGGPPGYLEPASPAREGVVGGFR